MTKKIKTVELTDPLLKIAHVDGVQLITSDKSNEELDDYIKDFIHVLKLPTRGHRTNRKYTLVLTGIILLEKTNKVSDENRR